MSATSPTSAAGLGQLQRFRVPGDHQGAHRGRHLQTDDLRGIKENVIMGRLIPAGTGLPPYKRLNVVVDDKAPSYMPPVIPKVTPAELSSAVGEE